MLERSLPAALIAPEKIDDNAAPKPLSAIDCDSIVKVFPTAAKALTIGERLIFAMALATIVASAWNIDIAPVTIALNADISCPGARVEKAFPKALPN